MDPELRALVILLALIWSLIYWIGGGVMFSLVSLLRLGRVRKVRFSCLFTLLAFACGIIASYVGVGRSGSALNACLGASQTKAQSVVALFGCGFETILIAFVLGAVALIAGGFLILALSSTSTRPWVRLEHQDEEPEEPVV